MRLNKTVALRKSVTSTAATDRPRPGNSQTPSEMALPSICSTGKFQFNSYDARPPVFQPSSSDPAGFYRNFQPVAVKAPCGQAVEDDDDEYYSDDDDSEYFPQKEGKHAVMPMFFCILQNYNTKQTLVQQNLFTGKEPRNSTDHAHNSQ